jgi:hypothetical protein
MRFSHAFFILTDPLAVAIFLPHLVAGGYAMNKRSLILKIIVIANALLITTAFVGCPARQDPSIVTIAPPPLVTIAPYGGNFQHVLPPDPIPQPPGQDSKNDKRTP